MRKESNPRFTEVRMSDDDMIYGYQPKVEGDTYVYQFSEKKSLDEPGMAELEEVIRQLLLS